MVPACRSAAAPFEVPKLALKPGEVEDFIGERHAFHALFAECFARPATQRHISHSMGGPFGTSERKSIAPMALHVEGGHVRGMQRSLNDAVWDEDPQGEPCLGYSLSNAPWSTPLSRLVWLSGFRWAIAQGCEEAKSELGMDHDDVRTFPGWHRHLWLSILAHVFLWHLKVRLGEKSTGTDRLAASPAA